MTNKQLAEQLRGIGNSLFDKTYDPDIKLLLDEASDRLENQSKWISVDKRLPDLFKTVLVYDTHTECVRISLYRGPDEVWRNGRISHWMPFPEPPKMKGGE